MLVTFKPISHRAKNRINLHGEVFELKQKGRFHGENVILVESLEATWHQVPRIKQKWSGWFTAAEIEFESITAIPPK